MPHLVPCTEEHIEQLKPRLREMDRIELELSSDQSPEVTLEQSFLISEEAHAVVRDGVALCVFGLAPHPQSKDWGVPWLLASEEFYDIGFTFARQCREGVERMHNRYPNLINMVYAKNLKAIRWLKWCGFTFHKPICHPVSGAAFIPFTKESPNV